MASTQHGAPGRASGVPEEVGYPPFHPPPPSPYSGLIPMGTLEEEWSVFLNEAILLDMFFPLLIALLRYN